jgi:5-methylcytosine-specific restriction enzyme subunit McrC
LDQAAVGRAVKEAAKIRIENIYYLFCYAWNRFEEAQAIELGGSESPDLLNLLAKVLLRGTRTLLKRGLDREYQLTSDSLNTVRGRIDLSGSLQLQSRRQKRLICEFDELSTDILHNQILKASLKRLTLSRDIERGLKHDLLTLAQRMSAVRDITLRRSDFDRVCLHRNNAYYDLLLKVAALAYDSLLPDPLSGGYAFQDILRDERKMAAVFQDFVRNFFALEQEALKVEPLSIAWQATPLTVTGAAQLPRMIVDVHLRGPNRTIIIDTKYYPEALQSYHDASSFRSAHLYQLFSYLRNVSPSLAEPKHIEGMLIYPWVDTSLRETYEIHGHKVTIATIDLAQSWKQVRNDLLRLLDCNFRPAHPTVR